MLEDRLFPLRDEGYCQFQRKLIPSIDPETILGVRMPQLRALVKALPEEETSALLAELPHRWYEENQLHALILSEERNWAAAICGTEKFLPYVDNWSTCDQLRPKAFSDHHKELLPYIRCWLTDERPYTVRFGIEMLMLHYLDRDFRPEYLELVAGVRREEYYVRMMVAWYFATALAKQYDAVLPYITGFQLEKWTHNKTIQKSVESFCIPDERKEVLRRYRRK